MGVSSVHPGSPRRPLLCLTWLLVAGATPGVQPLNISIYCPNTTWRLECPSDDLVVNVILAEYASCYNDSCHGDCNGGQYCADAEYVHAVWEGCRNKQICPVPFPKSYPPCGGHGNRTPGVVNTARVTYICVSERYTRRFIILLCLALAAGIGNTCLAVVGTLLISKRRSTANKRPPQDAEATGPPPMVQTPGRTEQQRHAVAARGLCCPDNTGHLDNRLHATGCHSHGTRSLSSLGNPSRHPNRPKKGGRGIKYHGDKVRHLGSLDSAGQGLGGQGNTQSSLGRCNGGHANAKHTPHLHSNTSLSATCPNCPNGPGDDESDFDDPRFHIYAAMTLPQQPMETYVQSDSVGRPAPGDGARSGEGEVTGTAGAGGTVCRGWAGEGAAGEGAAGGEAAGGEAVGGGGGDIPDTYITTVSRTTTQRTKVVAHRVSFDKLLTEFRSYIKK